MVSDIKRLSSGSMEKFSQCVTDEFGLSIMRDVFEPVVSEIYGLEQMSENTAVGLNEINQQLDNLRSINFEG